MTVTLTSMPHAVFQPYVRMTLVGVTCVGCQRTCVMVIMFLNMTSASSMMWEIKVTAAVVVQMIILSLAKLLAVWATDFDVMQNALTALLHMLNR